jgi:hypothetical protein
LLGVGHAPNNYSDPAKIDTNCGGLPGIAENADRLKPLPGVF